MFGSMTRKDEALERLSTGIAELTDGDASAASCDVASRPSEYIGTRRVSSSRVLAPTPVSSSTRSYTGRKLASVSSA
jgi:hypothetical protein